MNYCYPLNSRLGGSQSLSECFGIDPKGSEPRAETVEHSRFVKVVIELTLFNSEDTLMK
jgi:hypothetical protein